MELEYQRIGDWPPLAWLAISQGPKKMTVAHGSMVETAADRFCEAVWDDDYAKGNFDETDIVAGSGGRRRANSIIFVSSGSTVDRLVYWKSENKLLVSNSIACLLSAAKGDALPEYPHYMRLFQTIVFGLKRYKRWLPTSIGDLRLVYFENLMWDGSKVSIVSKPRPLRDFRSFERYYSFLRQSMRRIAENASAIPRSFPYRAVCTVSSGYDSPAVAVLAGMAGCKRAICIDPAGNGIPEDGASIARLLGLEPEVIGRNEWRRYEFSEIPFLVGDSTTEAVSLHPLGPRLSGALLFTGNYGGVVWGKKPPHLGPDLVRGDTSGLSHTEFRLWHGYIHCPVPFWGAYQIRDINRIALSDEMRHWDVEGNYSRPIPRRILETAGVPRGMFAVRKLATAVYCREFCFSTSGVGDDYVAWLRRHRLDWIKQGRVPPICNVGVDRWLTKQVTALEDFSGRVPFIWRIRRRDGVAWPFLMRRYVYAWAIEHAKTRYDSVCS
jgi:hypothetical protein